MQSRHPEFSLNEVCAQHTSQYPRAMRAPSSLLVEACVARMLPHPRATQRIHVPFVLTEMMRPEKSRGFIFTKFDKPVTPTLISYIRVEDVE